MFFQTDEDPDPSLLKAPARGKPDLQDSSSPPTPGVAHGANEVNMEKSAAPPYTELEIAQSFWVNNHDHNQKKTLDDTKCADILIHEEAIKCKNACLWRVVLIMALTLGVGSVLFVIIRQGLEGQGRFGSTATQHGQGNQTGTAGDYGEVATNVPSSKIIEAFDKVLHLADEYTFYNNNNSPQAKAIYLIKNGIQTNTLPSAFYGNHTFDDIYEALAETYVLLVLAYSIGDGKWSKPNPWPSMIKEHYCLWYGVLCFPGRPQEVALSKRVKYIDIKNVALQSGTIPREIGHLSNLEMLRISKNRLEGSVPSEIYHLTNLEILDLGDNRLAFSVSDQIGRLSKLADLSIQNNYAKGALPETMQNLTNLVRLDLSNNRLSGPIFDIILKNPKIMIACLNYNEFDVTIPSEIGRVTSLLELELFDTRIPGSIPTEIGLLSSLKVFTVSHELSGTIPVEIGQCKSLHTLRMINNENIGGTIPSTLGRLTSLSIVDLADNRLQGTLPSELGLLTDIYQLSLHNNLLSGFIPTEFAEFLNLNLLSLDGNKDFYGEIPKEICSTPKLSYDCSIKCDCCYQNCFY